MKMLIAFIVFVIMSFLTIMVIERKGSLFTIMIYYEPEVVNGMGNILSSLGLFWAIIAVFVSFFISYLCSDKKIEKYKNKRTEYYKTMFDKI